jgi:hypothetical protein
MSVSSAPPEPSLVGDIMGSQSDWEVMRHAAATLAVLGVPHETRVVSAHRTPDALFAYAEAAQGRGLEVIIAGLPLGSTAAVGHWASVNLLGAPPAPQPLPRLPDTHLHRYGKVARPGRKIGHVTTRAADPAAFAARLAALGAAVPDAKGDLSCELD